MLKGEPADDDAVDEEHFERRRAFAGDVGFEGVALPAQVLGEEEVLTGDGGDGGVASACGEVDDGVAREVQHLLDGGHDAMVAALRAADDVGDGISSQKIVVFGHVVFSCTTLHHTSNKWIPLLSMG